MSLSINIRVYNENGEYSEIELDNGRELAGGENFRRKLYGSDLAKTLGFELLPQLKRHDLYVEPQKLNELENEFKTILEKVDEFAREVESEQEYVKARVQNVLNVVQIARKEKGTIVIW